MDMLRLVRLLTPSSKPTFKHTNIESDHAENFAQEVVIAAYDKIVPGGIASLVPNYEDVYNQFVAVQNAMGDELCPGGTCDRLFEDEYARSTYNSMMLTVC
jgi:hypothetical protein